MKKKAELTTQQIVGLVILILSFAVILFLLVRLNLGQSTSDEICHNSVLMQAKTSGVVGALDCRTNYICFSAGQKCENINPTKTVEIKLTYDAEKDKENVMKIIADEMSKCWWMFGEGKTKYVSTLSGMHCAICSVVGFDSEIQGKVGEINYDEFYKYLQKTQKSKSQTYLQYLYGISSVSDFEGVVTTTGKIFTNEKYSIITGMNKEFKFFNIGLNDKIVYPTFIKSDEIKTKTSCEIFDITKA